MVRPGAPFATSPLTQGALVRSLLRAGASAGTAVDVLRSLTASERHTFRPDDRRYTEVDLRAVVGHQQVTDAHLADLARSRRSRLVTLDRALASLHPDAVVLLDP